MLPVLSRVLPLSSEREKAVASELPQLVTSLEEVWSLRCGISFDSRGYTEMACALSGKETPREALLKLAITLAPTNAEAIAYAAKKAPSNILERAELCIRAIKPELPLLSLDRFRLAVIEGALEKNPLTLDAARIAQTLLDIAEKIGPVKAAEVTAYLVVPPLGTSSLT